MVWEGPNPLPKKVVAITGPTCSGKDTLLKYLVQNYPIAKVLSDVTREKREGEVDGVDYNFVTREFFEEGIAKGEYFNHVEFQGNRYGAKATSIVKTVESGKIPIFILEPKGLDCLVDLEDHFGLKPFSVFVDAPLEDLMSRYFKRTGSEGLDANPRYHLQRLQGMLKESKTWIDSYKFDLVIHNDEYEDMPIEFGAFKVACRLGLIGRRPKMSMSDREFFRNTIKHG
ncbi:MAG TPA: guanylate kinase [Bacteroidia bacterium]|nr:guanylate kinase [Bacteroidia bacterium]